MADPLLVLEDVCVRYDRLLAVDHVSFALSAGELLGLIGANGAGKTTTLRAAAGLQPVTTGRIRVMGYNVASHDVRSGFHVGFTPDTPTVYDTLTVREFLEFIAGCYRLPARLANERIDHWIDALWLQEKINTRISSLSRGMRQRLAVARTLVPDPHVVLLDEPAAGLDPAGRVHFRQLLASLRDQGKAVIVSSHILADLAEYSTHVGIMERGRLLQFGRVSQFAPEAAANRVTTRVVLASRPGDLDSRLSALTDAAVIRREDDALLIEHAEGRPAAARLLSELLAAGLPVAEFTPRKVDLEEVYLRSGVQRED